ncbi:MAG TPA: phosphoglucosamine mutase [Cytophagaceae bacterium]|nr:phosphoglucosamine mutase [Cytophagaceae bacterium]
MSLIKSISGIRGTIGGKSGETLSPLDVVKFTAAYAEWAKKNSHSHRNKIVIGRDARVSGEMISRLVVSTLQGMGLNVIDLGLSTTPTVELAVTLEGAAGGIIITASHNPANWNALKLLNEDGEFLSDKDGKQILEFAEKGEIEFCDIKKLGKYSTNNSYINKHIELILNHPLVDIEAIKKRNFKIAIDCVNSTGGIAVPLLLEALGVKEVTKFFCEPTGLFPHNPEPLPENLTHISGEISKGHFDLGIVVDPDVDRLCFINQDGSMFGEEYTLVAVADYVLQHKPGNTVSNLSSTRALRDITEKARCKYFASAVGEVNVVKAMKDHKAVIGGEGNGGIIIPELHYGRDALAGIALFLTHLAKFGKSISLLRAKYPSYHISKNKVELTSEIDVDCVIEEIKNKYSKQPINTVDGVKIEFDKEWVHLRKSNTEPIIRIYSESDSHATADHLAMKLITDIKEIIERNACLLR